MDLPQSEMTKSVYEYDSFNGCKRAKCEDRVIEYVRERRKRGLEYAWRNARTGMNRDFCRGHLLGNVLREASDKDR